MKVEDQKVVLWDDAMSLALFGKSFLWKSCWGIFKFWSNTTNKLLLSIPRFRFFRFDFRMKLRLSNCWDYLWISSVKVDQSLRKYQVSNVAKNYFFLKLWRYAREASKCFSNLKEMFLSWNLLSFKVRPNHWLQKYPHKNIFHSWRHNYCWCWSYIYLIMQFS